MLRGLLATIAAVSSLSSPHATTAFSKQDTAVTMSDGTQIAVTYYEPEGTPPAGGWPAVMMFHGLGQTRNSFDLNTWSANRVAETYLVPRGYAVLTFDARAHGESGGLFSLDGPRELQDTRELFAWLTSHRDVNASRVGAFGVSYGGGMVWLATVKGVPFRAIAVAASWTDLREALAPAALLRAGILVGFAQDIPQSRYDPAVGALLQDALHQRNIEGIRAFLAERSTRSQLASVTTPTFMLQGRRDFAFDANQAIAAYKLLKGPKRLYLGDLGHTPAPNPVAEIDHFAVEIRGWFDRYLKDVTTADFPPGRVELARAPWDGRTVVYGGLPPTRTLRFSSNRRARLTATGRVVRTFAPVRHLETFGLPVVRATVTSPTGYDHVVAVLSAVKGDKEILISDGGAATPGLGRKPRVVSIRLQNEITPIPKGARLRLTLAATSTAQSVQNLVYLIPVQEKQTATIGRVTLTLPVLKQPISP